MYSFIEYCIEENLCILNKQTKWDESGELTEMSGIGCSVYDIWPSVKIYISWLNLKWSIKLNLIAFPY